MSEYVIGYLLAHERKIFQRLEAQKNKKWDDSDTGTLRGKTIGLLGVGSIGAEVARTAKFFGMNVRGYTRGSETSKHVDEYYHLWIQLWSPTANCRYSSKLPYSKVCSWTGLPRQYPAQHNGYTQDRQC